MYITNKVTNKEKKLIKIVLFLGIFLLGSIILSGAVSAATVHPTQISTNKTNKVGATAKPDLKPTSITNYDYYGTFYVKLGVKNYGNKASKSFTSNIYINGKLLGSVSYGAVNIGKSVYASKKLPTGIKAGRYTFKNVVDPQNKILESNEKNNDIVELEPLRVLKASISLTAAPTMIRCDEDADLGGTIGKYANEIVTFKIRITNTGTAPIDGVNIFATIKNPGSSENIVFTAETMLKYYWSGERTELSPLEPGQYRDIIFKKSVEATVYKNSGIDRDLKVYYILTHDNEVINPTITYVSFFYAYS